MATRPETCTLQLWLLLLLYPSLAKTALIPFDCVRYGGDRLLRADPVVACDDASWRLLALIGGLGTLLYSLGFPLLCYLVTRSSHRATTAAANGASEGASAGVEQDSTAAVVAR